MDPQVDTAQQRAEAIYAAIADEHLDKDYVMDTLYEYAQQARRDALAESADIAFDHQCEDPQWCNCNSAIYKALDRLREGV